MVVIVCDGILEGLWCAVIVEGRGEGDCCKLSNTQGGTRTRCGHSGKRTPAGTANLIGQCTLCRKRYLCHRHRQIGLDIINIGWKRWIKRRGNILKRRDKIRRGIRRIVDRNNRNIKTCRILERTICQRIGHLRHRTIVISNRCKRISTC